MGRARGLARPGGRDLEKRRGSQLGGGRSHEARMSSGAFRSPLCSLAPGRGSAGFR